MCAGIFIAHGAEGGGQREAEGLSCGALGSHEVVDNLVGAVWVGAA